MTLQVKVNLLQDNDGVPGESLSQDKIAVSNSFFVEIEIADVREDATGVIGLALDLEWDASVLEALDSEIANTITSSLPFSPRGTVDNSNGIIRDLGAGSLPNAGIGAPVGIEGLERFALLHFQGESITENFIPLTITIDPRNVAFVDSSTPDNQIDIEVQTVQITSDSSALELNNPLRDLVSIEDSNFSTTIPRNTFNGAEGNILSYSATLEDGSELPDWLTFDSETRTFNGTPTNSDVGNINVKVIATNEDGVSASDSFVLTVENVDDPPVVRQAIADIEINEDANNTVIDLNTVFQDIDNDDIEIVLTSNSNNSLVNVNIDDNNLVLDYQDNQSGIADITLQATSNGEAVEDTFTVYVDPVDDLPFVNNPLEDINVDEDSEDTIIDLSNVFKDIDNDEIKISVAGNNNNLLVNANIDGNNLILDYQNNQSGIAEITLLGISNNQIVLDTFSIDVIPVDDPPVVSFNISTDSSQIVEGDKITINFNVDGEIPEEGLFVLLEGDTENILNEFELFNPDGSFSLETSNIGNLSAANIIENKVLIPLTANNASLTLTTAIDDIDEGLEEYSFSLVDSEQYEIDADSQQIAFGIYDSVLDPNTESYSTIFGTIQEDSIEVEGSSQIIFAGDSNDLIDLTYASGDNRVYAGNGNDIIILGVNENIFGDSGDDSILITSQGSNIINGNSGEDQFWIANAEIPKQANIINDFIGGEDIIGIAGLGIGYNDLIITDSSNGALISVPEGDLAIIANTPADFIASEAHFVFA